MKKIILPLIALGLMLVSGCGTVGRTVNEDGYQELTKSEIALLVKRARAIVAGDKKELHGNQYEFVRRNEPEVRISYRDDCYGRAIITWNLESERKKFRVVFTGILNSDNADSLVARYSVLRETSQQTIEDTGASFKPDLKFTRQEWNELKKR